MWLTRGARPLHPGRGRGVRGLLEPWLKGEPAMNMGGQGGRQSKLPDRVRQVLVFNVLPFWHLPVSLLGMRSPSWSCCTNGQARGFPREAIQT